MGAASSKHSTPNSTATMIITLSVNITIISHVRAFVELNTTIARMPEHEYIGSKRRNEEKVT